ncbi:MAG TPA: LacI family DNA-binding transcriptional regulator [Candidatus Limiplasma sp.]|nr:LacI family DNA-binding transcriptional regulator [Candidatus Limiplasma sp.]
MKASSTSPLKQIAESLHLSQSTVSIVLNGRGDELRISEATQKRVREAARSIDYRPNIYARRLRKSSENNARVVGIFWSSLFLDESMGRFFRGATNYVEEKQLNCDFIIRFFLPGKLQAQRDQFTSWQFSSVIVSGASGEDVEFLSSLGNEIPIVVANDSSANISGISIDHYQLGKRCAQTLIDYGHRRIAVVGVDARSAGSSIRLAGFLDSCRENRVDIPDEWMAAIRPDDGEACRQYITSLFTAFQPPTALFVLRDTSAVNVILAMREQGIRINEDCALLVHGVNKTMQVLAPNAAYVDITMEEFAHFSIDLAVTLMNNNITTPLKRIMTPKLQIATLMRAKG